MSLIHLMALAQHRLFKRSDAAFGQALDITTTQLGVLFVLEKNPKAQLKDLSETLGINRSAVTTLVDRMETAGLVQRQPCDDDGRATRLCATREGLAKAAAAKPILASLNARITEGFDEAEIATVGRFLQRILDRS